MLRNVYPGRYDHEAMRCAAVDAPFKGSSEVVSFLGTEPRRLLPEESIVQLRGPGNGPVGERCAPNIFDVGMVYRLMKQNGRPRYFQEKVRTVTP